MTENILRGLIGVIVLLGIGVLMSKHRKKINWRLVIGGIALQVILALLILATPFSVVVEKISAAFVTLLGFSDVGAEFMFGTLIDASTYGFAFKVLPTILFVAALTSLLYYLGVLQWIVFGFAWLMKRLMKLSGAESLAAAANVFVGQTEAPLVVKPYIDRMTSSELMALMTGGMATIAGSVFGLYVVTLGGGDVEAQVAIARQLLTASMMNAPAALLVAKILVPEREEVSEDLFIPKEKAGRNALDALAKGTTEGLKLALNVAAMLIVFVAVIAMFNAIFGWVGDGEKGKTEATSTILLSMPAEVFSQAFRWRRFSDFSLLLSHSQLERSRVIFCNWVSCSEREWCRMSSLPISNWEKSTTRVALAQKPCSSQLSLYVDSRISVRSEFRLVGSELSHRNDEVTSLLLASKRCSVEPLRACLLQVLRECFLGLREEERFPLNP